MTFFLKDNRPTTQNKTIRFPEPLVEIIEDILRGTNISFSSFVVQACYYAVDNMPDEAKEKIRQSHEHNKSGFA